MFNREVTRAITPLILAQFHKKLKTSMGKYRYINMHGYFENFLTTTERWRGQLRAWGWGGGVLTGHPFCPTIKMSLFLYCGQEGKSN
jgi:hypothetical protein